MLSTTHAYHIGNRGTICPASSFFSSCHKRSQHQPIAEHNISCSSRPSRGLDQPIGARKDDHEATAGMWWAIHSAHGTGKASQGGSAWVRSGRSFFQRTQSYREVLSCKKIQHLGSTARVQHNSQPGLHPYSALLGPSKTADIMACAQEADCLGTAGASKGIVALLPPFSTL
jgi:hypothetical protein